MTIKAMEQAIEALNEAVAFREGGRQKAIDAITALRTTIQQAEAQQPVAWMHWLHGPVQVLMNKDEAMMELERLNREYPSGADDRKMRPLVFGDTYPAPGVPGGYVLVPLKATPKVAMVLYEGARNCFSPKVAEGLYQDALTAAQAQKGGE